MVRKAHFCSKYPNFDLFPDIIRDELAKRSQFGWKLIIFDRKSLEMSLLDKLYVIFLFIFDQKRSFLKLEVQNERIFTSFRQNSPKRIFS